MSKVSLFLVLALATTWAADVTAAQACQIFGVGGQELAAVASTGAVGVPNNGGTTYQFVGITTQNPVTRRQEIFANPSIVSRGNETSCWMLSGGLTDDDGAVYDFAGTYIGQIKDDKTILDRRGAVVATYGDACDQYPISLKRRLIGGAALLMMLHEQGDGASDYWLTFPISTCTW